MTDFTYEALKVYTLPTDPGDDRRRWQGHNDFMHRAVIVD